MDLPLCNEFLHISEVCKFKTTAAPTLAAPDKRRQFIFFEAEQKAGNKDL